MVEKEISILNGSDSNPLTDPFTDIDKLRIDSAAEATPTRRMFTTIAVRKPKKLEFVRTHPVIEASAFGLLRDPNDTSGGISGTVYLVTPDVADKIPSLIERAFLWPAITRQGTPFLWPIAGRNEGGYRSESALSQEAAAFRARDAWLRIEWSAESRSYLLHEAAGNLPDPVWPENLDKLVDFLRLAFGGRRLITSLHDSEHRRIINGLLGQE